ncbi:hypothetical protein JZ751_008511 [Albula glossodonta]|uniref:Transmembrane protein 198 n=1 Tax=Albula glossodonta TaxID=121402 RepID=A0A8T2MSR6_9TELE|nr:hypothetical protein JZ751_008511 [Albula glossodonta]
MSFGCHLVAVEYIAPWERVLDTQLSVEASAGIGLGIGVLCGLVTMLVRSVGLFMTGLLLGLTARPRRPAGGRELPQPRHGWQRTFTVLSTRLRRRHHDGVRRLLREMLALAAHAYACLRLEPPQRLCWYSWVILGIWPTLSIMGVLVQWKLKAGVLTHRGRQKRVQLMRIRQKDARKRQQSTGQEGTYRRKPAPVKRYAGDLLARNAKVNNIAMTSYLQSLRDRHMGTGHSQSSLGTPNQTMIDFDCETGSTVPLTPTSTNTPVIRV